MGYSYLKIDRLLKVYIRYLTFCGALLFAACSTTKHIPDGKYLLKNTTISIADNDNIGKSELENYLV